MKMVKIVLMASGVFFLSNCITQRNFQVNTKEALAPDMVPFSTYSIFKNSNKATSPLFTNEIEKSLKYQMELRGFEYNEENPDVIVIPQLTNHNIKKGKKSHKTYFGITILHTKNLKAQWVGWMALQERQNDIRSERNIRRTIMVIFDQYKVFKRGFLVKNQPFSKGNPGREVVVNAN